MDLNPYGVAIARGDGLVARAGDVVMYLADAPGAAALLRVLDSVAQSESSWRALAKALAAVALGPDSASIPPFGVLTPTDDGLLLILRGHVAAHVESGGAGRTMTGDRALTWVDEIVREPVDRLVIGGGSVSGLTACPHTDLHAGVVPGGGFVVQRVAKQIQPETPAAPPPHDALPIEPETRFVLSPSGEHAKAVQRQRPAASSGRDVPAPTGLQLPSPDRPDGAPARKPAPPTAMASPAIGALTVGDEAVYPLDRPYVIGRNPMIDAFVCDGSASPIVLPDEPQISRVHAYVTVGAGAVLVRDARTPGGTYVAAPGDPDWTRIGDRPTEVKPGWCIRIGERVLLYQKTTPAQ